MTKLEAIYNRVERLLTTGGRESGQAIIEYGRLPALVAMLAMTVITVFGGIGGEAFNELAAVFQPQGADGALPKDAYIGPRIAD